jgi:hypothetical protein
MQHHVAFSVDVASGSTPRPHQRHHHSAPVMLGGNSGIFDARSCTRLTPSVYCRQSDLEAGRWAGTA